MKRLHRTMILLSLGTLLACANAKPEELFGTWTITDNSRPVLPTDLQRASAKIVLNPDGTFVASDVPALFFFPGRRDARLESGKGNWRLSPERENQQLQLNFAELGGWTAELPYGTQLTVVKGLSSVTLYYFVGDPDEGRRVSFERQ